MTKGADLARAGCRYLGTPYTVMDCQAFVERALRDCGTTENLPGSNAWYREVKKNGWVGTPEECRKQYGKIPPGAFLFILKQDGKEPEKYRGDGIGNASHIGIYTSLSGAEMVWIATQAGVKDAGAWDFGSGAINSSSSRGHVCTSKFTGKSISGGWNRVGLWTRIDYGEGGTTMEPYQAEVIDGSLNLRKGPSTTQDRILQIPEGATVTVTDDQDGWSRVTYNGRDGYALSRFLRKIDTGARSIAVPAAELESIYKTIGRWIGKE